MEEHGSLGRVYTDGEVVLNEGDPINDFYVVQEGKVQMLCVDDGRETPLLTCGQGEIVGDWSLGTVMPAAIQLRAVGTARILTVQRRLLMRRIHEDPTLAFRVLEMMSRRLHILTRRIIDGSRS